MPNPSAAPRCRWVVAVLVSVLAFWPADAWAGPSPSRTRSTQTSSQERAIRELQAKRAQVRAEKARKAAKVDALQATDQQIQAALADLSSSVQAQTQAVEDAERGVAQAEADEAAAATAEAQAQAEIAALRGSIKQQAIDAYVNVPAEQDFTILSGDPNEALSRRTLMEFRSNRSLDDAERYRALQEDLAIQRSAKEEAAARAARHRAAAKKNLAGLQDAYGQQEKFQAQVEARLERELSEADALSQIDGALSTQITQQQASLAAALAARRRAAQAASATLTRAGRGPAAPRDAAVPSFTGSGDIVTVQGIRVHRSVAANFDGLLNAARAAGINFGGGGYRDPSGQIAVRRNNCGSSNYAIYQAPASSCSPPTARPGQSMHERGLAVDFTEGGRTLSRGSAGYGWLAANAARFGLYNLPSEPWHWSANGN